MSNKKETSAITPSGDSDASDNEGPTLSELSQDINTFIEQMEKMQNEDQEPDSQMTAMLESFRQISDLSRENPDMVPPPGLADYIKEGVAMLEEYDTCGPPGSEGEANFIGKVASAIGEDKYRSKNETDGDRKIQEGTLAMIHSLQSTNGKKLNGRRVLVLKYHPDQERWECRAEFEKGGPNATKALKEANLTRLRRKPLPTGPNRGHANIHGDLEQVPPKLCELLLNHQNEDFEPSRISFRGFAAHMFT